MTLKDVQTTKQYLVGVGYNGMPNGSGFKDDNKVWTKARKRYFGNLL